MDSSPPIEKSGPDPSPGPGPGSGSESESGLNSAQSVFRVLVGHLTHPSDAMMGVIVELAKVVLVLLLLLVCVRLTSHILTTLTSMAWAATAVAVAGVAVWAALPSGQSPSALCTTWPFYGLIEASRQFLPAGICSRV